MPMAMMVSLLNASQQSPPSSSGKKRYRMSDKRPWKEGIALVCGEGSGRKGECDTCVTPPQLCSKLHLPPIAREQKNSCHVFHLTRVEPRAVSVVL
jgi:hypothetical protein